MKVPLPKFLKDKTAAGCVGSVPSVPAISEEKGGYVRGPSLMHLLQQPAEEEGEEDKTGEAESVSNGHGSFVPISLLHLLQPQTEPLDTGAHNASLLHSATSVPATSFSPSFIPPLSPHITVTLPSASSAVTSDVPLSMPKLLFLRQSSIDETKHCGYNCSTRLTLHHTTRSQQH